MNADAGALTKSGETRVRRPKEITRSVILERAYEMYLARELVHGDERLSLVLDSLGYTTGAGYQIWPNQAAFRLELQVYIAEKIDYASLAPLVDQLMELRAADLSYEEYVLGLAELYYEYFIGREEFYLTLRFYAMGDEREPAITEALKDAYVQVGWELEAALVGGMERLGRRLKDNRSPAQLAGTITALCEGFALRARVGPEIARIEVDGVDRLPFAVAFLAVINDYAELI